MAASGSATRRSGNPGRGLSRSAVRPHLGGRARRGVPGLRPRARRRRIHPHPAPRHGRLELAPEVFRKVFGAAPGGLDLQVLTALIPRPSSRSPSPSLRIGRFHRLLEVRDHPRDGLAYEILLCRPGQGRRRKGRPAVRRDHRSRYAASTTSPRPSASGGSSEAIRIGGRFSVLSPFGLGPAASWPISTLVLDSAAATARAPALPRSRVQSRRGARTLLAAAALAGRDECALLLSPGLENFGAWIEQLLAESTGKEGRGILPLVRFDARAIEPFAGRLVAVHIGPPDDRGRPDALARLNKAGVPVIVLDVPCPDALGGQFFLWEMATAVAGHILKINPFDQPNVAASKKRTEAALRAFRETGRFPDVPAAGGGDLAEFMRQAGEADYAVVQAFLPPTKPIDLALRALASKLQKKIGRPVTYDFGPRFLHSTGQLHKGDAGRGLFLQLTARRVRDAAIPDGTDLAVSSCSFGTLIDAQSRGDREALLDKDRRVHSILLDKLPSDIAKLAARAAASV